MCLLYAYAVPREAVRARDVAVGDVVRLDDPQAHRGERVVICEERVVLELRPVGLAVPDSIQVTASIDAVIDRLGAAED
jgi:hypothetical protein